MRNSGCEIKIPNISYIYIEKIVMQILSVGNVFVDIFLIVVSIYERKILSRQSVGSEALRTSLKPCKCSSKRFDVRIGVRRRHCSSDLGQVC